MRRRATRDAADPYEIFMERAVQPPRFFMGAARSAASILYRQKKEAMPAASMLILMLASFALMIGYACLCERL